MPFARVSWFDGKDTATKQAIADGITKSFVRNTGIDAKFIFVIYTLIPFSAKFVKKPRRPLWLEG
jgi:4-oxalocrotonate tautomerase